MREFDAANTADAVDSAPVKLADKRTKGIKRSIKRYSLVAGLITTVVSGIWLAGLLNPKVHFQSIAANALTMPIPIAHEDPEAQPLKQGSPTQSGSDSDSNSDSSAIASHATPAPVSATAMPALAAGPSTKSSPSAGASAAGSRSSSFNVVLIGTDTWGGESARADTIMVAHVMPDQRKANIVSIPRDTRVYVQGVGYTKINHAHIVGEMKGGNRQGTLTLVQAVSDFLGIPVHQYMKTNFTGVINFIDTIGGIDLLVEQDVTITPEITIKQGLQHLDGQHALFLARERYSVAGGDFGRQQEQFRIMRAVAKQLLKPEQLPDLARLLSTGRKDILDTSFRDSDLISLAWLFKGMESDDFTYEQIPGQDLYAQDPLVGDKVYYWKADPEQVASIRERLFKE